MVCDYASQKLLKIICDAPTHSLHVPMKIFILYFKSEVQFWSHVKNIF